MATGSTLPRRLLARQLRELRTSAGVSAESARVEIGVSKQTFWRMENGLPMKLNPLFIRRLCEIYDVTPDLANVLLTLADECKAKGWWHAFSEDLPKSFGLYVGLEDAAHRIVSYQTTFVPGLLHTAEYRRELIWAEYPTMPRDDVERAVAIATQRQARLTSTDNPLTMEIFLDESVLHRVTGNRSVMADQLRHLADVAQLPNVSIRLIPARVGTYRGLLVGPFVMLEFPPHPTAYLTEPPVVYVEGFAGDLYLESPEEVKLYRGASVDILRVALDATESRALVLEMAEEYAG